MNEIKILDFKKMEEEQRAGSILVSNILISFLQCLSFGFCVQCNRTLPQQQYMFSNSVRVFLSWAPPEIEAVKNSDIMYHAGYMFRQYLFWSRNSKHRLDPF